MSAPAVPVRRARSWWSWPSPTSGSSTTSGCVLGPGMTALTGETGAGKTLLVGAIDLLLGGRADPAMVRQGCAEAVIEGRFLGRRRGAGAQPRSSRPTAGRRAYVDGRMATAAVLGRAVRRPDRPARPARPPVPAGHAVRSGPPSTSSAASTSTRSQAAGRGARQSPAALADLGGDAGARAREADLLRFQVAGDRRRRPRRIPTRTRRSTRSRTSSPTPSPTAQAAADAVESLSGRGGRGRRRRARPSPPSTGGARSRRWTARCAPPRPS